MPQVSISDARVRQPHETVHRHWKGAILLLVCLVAWLGCKSENDNAPADKTAIESDRDQPNTANQSATATTLTTAKREQIVEFCADCHAMPLATSFPKKSWHEEVERGFNFFFKAEDQRLSPPVFNDVVVYFREQAPESISVTQSPWPHAPDNTPFLVPDPQMRPVERGETLAAVAGMSLEKIGPNGSLVPVYCDMRRGEVAWVRRSDDGQPISEVITQLENPARAHACDLDADGIQDLVIAEMGSFQPADHSDGAVVWLRGTGPPGEFESHVILDDIGRIADVRSGDFDGDGDLDLVVGEFGWLTTGGIWILENQGVTDNTDGPPLNFQASEIDTRHGTIHVPVIDFEGDGDLDFVALVSQEYEAVDVFLNDGSGNFTRETLYEAGDPAFGSSGIELADIDSDGDIDVLYVNGDTFDSYFVKPYHSIRWLENLGDTKFEAHVLTDMPGAQHATMGDVDGDGDLDIVGVALMSPLLRTEHRDLSFGSVVLLQNDGGGQFSGTTLEQDACNHASCALFDFDGDGDLDLLVSNFFTETEEVMGPVTVWENRSK